MFTVDSLPGSGASTVHYGGTIYAVGGTLADRGRDKFEPQRDIFRLKSVLRRGGKG